MKKNKSPYCYFLTRLLLSPLTYVSAAVTIVFSVLQFFVFRNFFNGSATSDLKIFFQAFPFISILAVPALCLAVSFSSRDLSLPFSSLSVFLSRFLSLLTVQAFIILLTFVVPAAVSFFGDFELSQLFCGYCGLFLFYCSVIAVSVFADSFFDNKILSFLFSALVLCVVNGAHLINSNLSSSNPLAALFRFLSFAWHFDSAGKGVIDSRDVLYFVLMTVFFLFLSVEVCELRRGKKTMWNRKIFVSVTAGFCLLFALSQKIHFNIDTTSTKKYSVSEYSRSLLEQVEGQIEITYYRSDLLMRHYPQIREVNDYLEAYISSAGNITLSVADPDKKGVVEVLKKYGVVPQQINTSDTASAQINEIYSAIVIRYLDKVQVIPFVTDCNLLEYDLDHKIMSLAFGTVRKIQLVCGNGLSLERDYEYLQQWLEMQGFEVEGLSLTQFSPDSRYPLVVLGTTAFDSEQTEALENYLFDGGKAFICSAPYTINVNGDWSYVETSNKPGRLLNSFGVYPVKGIVCDSSCYNLNLVTSNQSGDEDASVVTKSRKETYPLWISLAPQTAASKGMYMFWPCCLECDSEAAGVRPVLYSGKTSWLQTKTDEFLVTNPSYVQKNSTDDQKKGPFVVGAEINGPENGFYTVRNGNVHAFVYGDCYAFTNSIFNFTTAGTYDFRCYDFLTDCLLDLNGEASMVPLRNKSRHNDGLYKMNGQQLLQARGTTVLLCLLIPLFVIALLAVVVFVLRRKFNRGGTK